MGRADDDEAIGRRGRAKPRLATSSSVANMYAPINDATSHRHPPYRTSSKMKMASLMAVMDDSDENQHKRVKVDGTKKWTHRNASISISSLTTNDEPSHEVEDATSVFQDEVATTIEHRQEEKPREVVATHEANGEIPHRNGHGDASPGVRRSMYDFYFPTGKRTETSEGGMNRSLKRKRRTGRRMEELAATELDMLRFGVDVAKLVPQGLVDRIDVHMNRLVRIKVVSNHVTNWCNRSGFASSFLEEITTLLAAYYPCTYATLLDEVFAGFLLKRPEFMHLLLPAMLAKMRKTGESILTTKYPVTDALVRMCSVKTGPHALEQHNLVCTSLLRCLLEHNGDRFVLSPWIAACALTASDRVLRTLWRALLYHIFNAEDTFLDEKDLDWRIECPAQQIVELLAEEGKLRVCRLTCGFIELLLADDILKERLVELQSYLISECLMRAFRHATTYWSMSLMVEWLERRRKHHPEGGGGVFKELVDFLARFTLKLSVKKPEWFINHILSFILSSQCPTVEQEPALRVILGTYAPFVFGGIDLQWLDQKSRQNGYFEISATSIRTTEDLDSVTCQSSSLIRSNIELLIGLLVGTDACISVLFVDIWSEVWIEKEEIPPWGYVYALLCVFIQKTIDKHCALDQRLERFTIRVCQAYYGRLSHHLGQDSKRDDVAIKFSEALNLLFHSECPVAGVLLHEVVGILAGFEKGHASAFTIFGNVVILLLERCGASRMETSGKRDVVQKSLVAYESAAPATSRSSSTTIVHILTRLKTLVSTQDKTGELTRCVLSSERVVRLFANLLNVGRLGRKQEILLDVMNVVMRKNAFANQEGDWSRRIIVHELVHYAYRSRASSMTNALSVLHTIFRQHENRIPALWVLLQQCTKLWCGEELNGDNVAESIHTRAGALAELVKVVVLTLPRTIVRDIVQFMNQRLFSCVVGTTTRMNLFLLLLLQKLVGSELACGVLFLPVVQVAVCPLAPIHRDQTRMVQLQILKTLCTRLTSIRHHPVASKGFSADADWRRCMELICTERVQSELRSLVKETSRACNGVYRKVACHRASIVLAQSILAFTRRQRQATPYTREETE